MGIDDSFSPFSKVLDLERQLARYVLGCNVAGTRFERNSMVVIRFTTQVDEVMMRQVVIRVPHSKIT
jgi:hypothetical protein